MLQLSIQQAIETALLTERESASSIYVVPANHRSYSCRAEACERPAYASGLCSAHYQRAQKGRDMSVALRARKREDKCAECGSQTGAKGGWGLCVPHYRARRYAAIKRAAVEALGGKCNRCALTFPLAVYDFHHLGAKSDHPSALMKNRSPAAIAEELARCELLCANCHRVEHANEL